jgi:hypothetical protein
MGLKIYLSKLALKTVNIKPKDFENRSQSLVTVTVTFQNNKLLGLRVHLQKNSQCP